DPGERVGHGLHEVADGQALQRLAGAVSQLEKDGWEGEVECHAEGEGACGAGAAAGGLVPAAEQGGAGRLPASAAVAAGGPQGDHGGGAQAGADRLPPGALRGGLRQADGGGVCGAGEAASGETAQATGAGAGLRAEADRGSGGAGGGGAVGSGSG